MIPRFPNGATQHSEAMLFHECGRQTRGTETSNYPQEEKTKVIAQVVASERALAQTVDVAMHLRGCRTATFVIKENWKVSGKPHHRG